MVNDDYTPVSGTSVGGGDITVNIPWAFENDQIVIQGVRTSTGEVQESINFSVNGSDVTVINPWTGENWTVYVSRRDLTEQTVAEDANSFKTLTQQMDRMTARLQEVREETKKSIRTAGQNATIPSPPTTGTYSLNSTNGDFGWGSAQSTTPLTITVNEGSFTSFETVSILESIDASSIDDKSIAYLRGFSSEDDGGEGFFWLDKSGTLGASARDGGTIFMAAGGTDWYWRRIYQSAFNVQWFGANGDGTIDAASAFSSAVNALSDGGTLEIPSAKTFLFLSAVTVTDKNITIRANGSTFKQGDDSAIFRFINNFDASVSVSSIAKETYAFSGSNSNVTRLTAAGHNYVSGDLVKVYSEDRIPGSRFLTTDNEARIGEFALVGAVSGDDVYLYSELREHDQFTTGIKVAKLPRRSVVLSGLILDAPTWAERPDWTSGLIAISGYVSSRVDGCKVIQGHGSAFGLSACYDFEASNCSISRLKNDNSISPAAFGYGFNMQSCEFLRINNCYFSNSRHGTTTNTAEVLATSVTPVNSGRTYGLSVNNCHGHNCSAGAFDTHDDAMDVFYSNCLVTGDYVGYNTFPGQGFTVRGCHIYFTNCKVRDSIVGFNVFDTTNADGSKTQPSNIHFTNCHTDTHQQGIRLKAVKDIYIRDCSLKNTRATGTEVFEIGDTADGVFVDNLKVISATTENSKQAMFLKGSTNLRFKNITIDQSAATGSGTRGMLLARAMDLVIDGLDYIRPASVSNGHISYFESDIDLSATVELKRVRSDLDLGGYFGGSSNMPTVAPRIIDGRIGETLSKIVNEDISGSGHTWGAWDYVGDDHVLVYTTLRFNPVQVISALTNNGFKEGQLLEFYLTDETGDNVLKMPSANGGIWVNELQSVKYVWRNNTWELLDHPGKARTQTQDINASGFTAFNWSDSKNDCLIYLFTLNSGPQTLTNALPTSGKRLGQKVYFSNNDPTDSLTLAAADGSVVIAANQTIGMIYNGTNWNQV